MCALECKLIVAVMFPNMPQDLLPVRMCHQAAHQVITALTRESRPFAPGSTPPMCRCLTAANRWPSLPYLGRPGPLSHPLYCHPSVLIVQVKFQSHRWMLVLRPQRLHAECCARNRMTMMRTAQEKNGSCAHAARPHTCKWFYHSAIKKRCAWVEGALAEHSHARPTSRTPACTRP